MENTSELKTLEVKWSAGTVFQVPVSKGDTVNSLKRKLYDLSRVLPEKQKLLGLKCKGKPATDDALIDDLDLNPKVKIMMMGTPEEKQLVLPDPNEGEDDEVINDLDDSKVEREIFDLEENKKKLQNRIDNLKVEIKNPPRKGKKCLVLDIDYTLFDHRSAAEKTTELMRPYLHEFLTECYKEYDLVLWSATSMKWIDVKMNELGVYNNPNYKITFALCRSAMFTVEMMRHGQKEVHDVKPLGVIWGKFPEYTAENTIHIDDLSRNFVMNPQNGLKIKPFKKAHLNRGTDDELLHLTKYLLKIAQLDSFKDLDHSKWKKYLNS